MSERLKPTPGNVVRNNDILVRIGCGSWDQDCDYFKGRTGVQTASGGITKGYCELVKFDKATDPTVKIPDLLTDDIFDGHPTTVFCGETCEGLIRVADIW